jgi:hypothetical protein
LGRNEVIDFVKSIKKEKNMIGEMIEYWSVKKSQVQIYIFSLRYPWSLLIMLWKWASWVKAKNSQKLRKKLSERLLVL